MLTIKHVDDDKRESVVSVVSVSFEPKEHCLVGCGPNSIEVARWSSGHAFVMNEQGKTVAVYSLTK
jgi:hypothetical protein